MKAAVHLTDLAIKRGGRLVVQELSASIEPQGWFGVVGANGSGKTTLLRAIAGRLPIAGGSCLIHGRELVDDRLARAEMVGFAPPIEKLPQNLRLQELINLAGEGVDEAEARCSDLWDALGIRPLLRRHIGEYSSGMRQRAAIALAFARPVQIVILDEPFNWLDPVAAFDCRQALGNMVREGMTLLTALHDLATLCGSCDAGMIMAEGRSTLTLTRDDLVAGQNDAIGFERKMIDALRKSA